MTGLQITPVTASTLVSALPRAGETQAAKTQQLKRRSIPPPTDFSRLAKRPSLRESEIVRPTLDNCADSPTVCVIEAPVCSHPVVVEETRCSARLAEKEEIVVYNTTRGRYYVYEIFDRDGDMYSVKWIGYKDEADNTKEPRDQLEKDGFSDLCDYVDKFKAWQAEETERKRTFQEFKAKFPIPRKFTADEEKLCYVASVRCAANLLNIPDFLPDGVLQRFFSKHPLTQSNGVSWQELTKLIQMCNSVKRKVGSTGFRFIGKRNKANLIDKKTGRLDDRILDQLVPGGVYICCVSMAAAGHMFVMHRKRKHVWVYDSAEKEPRVFKKSEFGWVVRWLSIHQCIHGHF